jgi:DNA-binding SARP family transcriptional activator/tetratricopeptide (TPR) repeat protein
VRVQILGSIHAWRDRVELDLGGPRQRAVFALLAAAEGKPLMRADLVDTLWYDKPPPSAANVISTYVKNLRRVLEPDRMRRAASTLMPSMGDGYALLVPAGGLDLARFRRLVTDATHAHRGHDSVRAAELFHEALQIWQGPPLADVAFLASHPKIVALADERWAAVARYGDAMIAIGAAADALPRLEEAATARPMDELAQARLIRAYHAAGRQSEGFAAYHAVRRRLADELGVDPGPELVAAHAALVHGNRPPASAPAAADAAPVLAEAAAAPVMAETAAAQPLEAAAPATKPAQLPPVTGAFIGRSDQLGQLEQLLPAGDPPDTIVVTISGAAGIGKTTLAAYWAHRVADRFPDGQLFVNLRGFDPSSSAMTPAEAVRGFLEAMQVPPQSIPDTFEAQVGLYRTLLSGRRMMIVLDNARDTAQVHPLLPGAPGCLVLVSSRNQLTGLVAEVAHPLTLGVLPVAEARRLLAARIGADRLAAAPAATDQIIDRCAGLPLALAIVAARAAIRPDLPLAALASELCEARDNLDGFAGGEAGADLRAVFSWSLEVVTPDAARLFRLLSVHPGPDIGLAAAASLAGLPRRRLRQVLAELTRAHLLAEFTPERYGFHDLLRAYATELAGEMDGEQPRAALGRVLDHYLHTAHAAAVLLDPHRARIDPGPPGSGVAPEQLVDFGHAMAWCTAERHVLVDAVYRAVAGGFDMHAWQLAWALKLFLHWRGYWYDWAGTQHAALRAAERLADPVLQARAHNSLASAYCYLGRDEDADSHLRRALDLFDAQGDGSAAALTHLTWSRLRDLQGQYRDALSHATQAFELFEAAGNLAGQGRALNAVGWEHAGLGEHRQAIVACRQAISVQQQIGDEHGEGISWDSLGYANHRAGQYTDAIACYQRAMGLLWAVGNRHSEAETLTHLGDTHYALDNLEEARIAWQKALTILEELGHSDTGQVRAKLQPQVG